MIDRYTTPEMTAVWSERRKLEAWTEVEARVLEAWEAEGVVPSGAAAALRAAPPINVEAWKQREAEIHHDLAAFVDVLAASMSEHGEWVHYGLTSSDVLDTALGVKARGGGEYCRLVSMAPASIAPPPPRRNLPPPEPWLRGLWGSTFSRMLASVRQSTGQVGVASGERGTHGT